ncbi:MAG: sigma-54-dependent Fis family transcriptional regulator [Bacteroidales bacterium]|nr:sigma-54-dependent Fis family transcriptional regulator [Bacteroidales bacterium]
MELREVKNRFGIIGDDPKLNTALDTALQISGTNLSVLITGESGVGKEVIPKIIHAYSPRKHNAYIAINCGAIPEGTIESELFGHEKGSFTGANEARKGYFEVADGGTIFLDEVGELPLSTQVRLLRVLESGEFIRVGSSKIQKTNVRVIAATNVNFQHAISAGKFREDLYYRLNAVPIYIPPLRERKGDIHLLFRHFALDFADRNRMPVVKLLPGAVSVIESYRWPGNVRQLKNVTEQISVLERERLITPEVIVKYLPGDGPTTLPMRYSDSGFDGSISDREILLKMLFSLREEVDSLRSEVDKLRAMMVGEEITYPSVQNTLPMKSSDIPDVSFVVSNPDVKDEAEELTEVIDVIPRTIHDMNEDMIRKALEKHDGKRKAAALELGISERTLYRKIKEMNL